MTGIGCATVDPISLTGITIPDMELSDAPSTTRYSKITSSKVPLPLPPGYTGTKIYMPKGADADFGGF